MSSFFRRSLLCLKKEGQKDSDHLKFGSPSDASKERKPLLDDDWGTKDHSVNA